MTLFRYRTSWCLDTVVANEMTLTIKNRGEFINMFYLTGKTATGVVEIFC